MPVSRGKGLCGIGRGRCRGDGGKYVQHVRWAYPDSQAYPEANRQNIASLMKVFVSIIQCLYHGHFIDGQYQDCSLAKAFQAKVKELNSFVLPAHSGPWVQAVFSKIKANWASQVSDVLAQHYVKVLADLKKKLLMIWLVVLIGQELSKLRKHGLIKILERNLATRFSTRLEISLKS